VPVDFAVSGDRDSSIDPDRSGYCRPESVVDSCSPGIQSGVHAQINQRAGGNVDSLSLKFAGTEQTHNKYRSNLKESPQFLHNILSFYLWIIVKRVVVHVCAVRDIPQNQNGEFANVQFSSEWKGI
jgi:hypothetical protein